MSEDESEVKAKRMAEMTKKLADECAKSFENWARNHRDSSVDEAHEQLVGSVVAAIVTNNLMLHALL